MFVNQLLSEILEVEVVHSRDNDRNVVTGLKRLVVLIILCASVLLTPSSSLGQNSVEDFHNILRKKLTFDESDLAALQGGNTVVKLLPIQDEREVAVAGSVGLQVRPQVFLESFRENMATKSNPAILEIGRFSNQPTLDDLKDLSFEKRDIEDLKSCVVGDCQLKLSASMIERLRQEMNWNAADYTIKATQLLKLMLLDYVRDYEARGDVALIEYSDKEKTVRLAHEQLALKAASTYTNAILTNSFQPGRSTLTNIDTAIVWSKIKFGLKPVISINHIAIYEKRDGVGPQVLIASKQIYANHYFNSSFALTAFVNIPGASPGSYLLYENRSRVDGFGGPFGSLKRGIVADKAKNALSAILDQSKARLNARALSPQETATPIERGRTRRSWRVAGVHLFFWLLLITAFAALLALRSYRWKTEVP
jgi:hypothetical protein